MYFEALQLNEGELYDKSLNVHFLLLTLQLQILVLFHITNSEGIKEIHSSDL